MFGIDHRGRMVRMSDRGSGPVAGDASEDRDQVRGHPAEPHKAARWIALVPAAICLTAFIIFILVRILD